MRTIRFTLNARTNPDMNISVSTEVVCEDEEAASAGEDTMRAVNDFLQGIGRVDLIGSDDDSE